MATVRDMIRKKGRKVFAVAPDATVFEALDLMAKHNIGALLVMTGEEMVGIVSERDCVRKVELMGRNAKDTKVSEIMTSECDHGGLRPAAGRMYGADDGEEHPSPACLRRERN